MFREEAITLRAKNNQTMQDIKDFCQQYGFPAIDVCQRLDVVNQILNESVNNWLEWYCYFEMEELIKDTL